MTIRFGTGSAVEKCSPWYPFSWGSKRPNPSDLMGDCAFSHYMFMFKGLLVEVSWLTLDVWAAGRARDPSACPSLASLTIREVYYLWLFVPIGLPLLSTVPRWNNLLANPCRQEHTASPVPYACAPIAVPAQGISARFHPQLSPQSSISTGHSTESGSMAQGLPGNHHCSPGLPRNQSFGMGTAHMTSVRLNLTKGFRVFQDLDLSIMLGVGARFNLLIPWSGVPANQVWQEGRRKESPPCVGIVSLGNIAESPG